MPAVNVWWLFSKISRGGLNRAIRREVNARFRLRVSHGKRCCRTVTHAGINRIECEQHDKCTAHSSSCSEYCGDGDYFS